MTYLRWAGGAFCASVSVLLMALLRASSQDDQLMERLDPPPGDDQHLRLVKNA